jgi:hypothetical protein
LGERDEVINKDVIILQRKSIERKTWVASFRYWHCNGGIGAECVGTFLIRKDHVGG